MYEFGLITTFSKSNIDMDYQEFKTALIEKYPNADYCDILEKITIEYESKKITFSRGSKGKFNYDQKMCKSGAAKKDKNIGDTKAKTSDKYNDLSMDKSVKQNLSGDNKAVTSDKFNDLSMDKGTKQNLGGDTKAKTSGKYNEAQLDAQTKENLKNKTQEELDYDYYKYQKVGDPGYKKRKDYDLDKFNTTSQRYIQEESKKSKKEKAKAQKEEQKEAKKISKKSQKEEKKAQKASKTDKKSKKF